MPFLLCPKCGTQNFCKNDGETVCKNCSFQIHTVDGEIIDSEEEINKQQELNNKIRQAKLENNFSNLTEYEIKYASRNIIVTGSMILYQRKIIREIDFISSQCVYGSNIIKDLLGGVRDIVGGRSVTIQKLISETKITLLNELKIEAFKIGADAIICTRVELGNSFGNSMIGGIATGTAVKLVPESN